MLKQKVFTILIVFILFLTCFCPGFAVTAESEAFEVSLIKTQKLTAAQWIKDTENQSYFTALAYVECILHFANDKEVSDKLQNSLIDIIETNNPIKVASNKESVFAAYKTKANAQILIEYNTKTKEMKCTFEEKNLTSLNAAKDVQLTDFIQKLNTVFGMVGVSLY